ncbi:unnamed protein product, partial [marine sediment metagenome]
EVSSLRSTVAIEGSGLRVSRRQRTATDAPPRARRQEANE